MFYYDGQRWMPFLKRVTYTKPVVEYDNELSRFEGLDNLKVTDNLLTDEELMRLEIIKNIPSMSLQDVINYVKGQELTEPPSAEVIEAEEREQEREAIKALINVGDAPANQVSKMKNMIKPYDPEGYFTPNDLVEHLGAVYVVLKPHRVADLKGYPDTEPLYYKLKVEASPAPEPPKIKEVK